MRPCTSPAALEAPCCSGRTPAEGYTWRRHQRVRVVAALGRSAAGGKSGGATRAEAYAASLGSAAAAAAAPTQQQQQQRVVLEEEGEQQQVDDYDRRPAGTRRKPLKINLDLALWRARKTRIEANRSSSAEERAALLRESEAALRRCMAMDPEDGRPYVSLGKIMMQQRRYDEAAKLYEEGCTATGGTNAHIWTAWAYLAARRGDVALARRLYDAALVANPAHAAAFHGWGLMERQQGNFLRARDLWARGIQATRRSPNPFLYQSLAVLAAEMDCVEEARKWFRQGTRTLQGSASHALWQAWALMEARQGTEPRLVRRLFAKGLEVSPRSRYTFLAWALWEAEQGNVEEARKLYRQGTALNPRDAAIFNAWAILEEKEGAVEEARRLFRRGARADPSHLYIWQSWGCLEFRQGNYDAARELFQQGIWAAPPGVSAVSLIFQAWAVLERAAGEVSVARQLFKCAVKADPKSEPSWLAWAQMEEELGALERANELRNFSMQERQEVVRPSNFTTMPKRSNAGVLEPVLDRIASWFKARDESAAAAAAAAASGSGAPAAGGGRGGTRMPRPLTSMDAFGSGSVSDLSDLEL